MEATSNYREIDRQLRSIAKRRAGLDVEEARWLREAEKLRVWRTLGFSTALEYLEDVFGFSPRTAMERMRVARELGVLRGLESELREGRLSYSAVKELSRVMTPATEAPWLARARGKNLRDIEALVAGRKKGDAPDTRPDPALLTRKLALELPARVDALLQQCRSVAEDEIGGHIEDVALLELLCRRFLEAPVSNEINFRSHVGRTRHHDARGLQLRHATSIIETLPGGSCEHSVPDLAGAKLVSRARASTTPTPGRPTTAERIRSPHRCVPAQRAAQRCRADPRGLSDRVIASSTELDRSRETGTAMGARRGARRQRRQRASTWTVATSWRSSRKR